MSGKVKHRAVWTPSNEQVLLELFEKAREDPASRKGRGIKPFVWAILAQDINQRCNGSFTVDQLKSKYARILMDYELFKEVGGEGSLNEQDWDELIQARPENALRLRQFKESGFHHAEICQRIDATKEDGTSVGRKLSFRIKRSSTSDTGAPVPKRACIHDGEWDLYREKLLLFLCWKAKCETKVVADDMLPQRWTDLTLEVNEYCTSSFTEKEVKEKYVELMQNYAQFKLATGFSGSTTTIPMNDMDWERLIRERPAHYLQLEKFKEAGGFPHAELCSLIKGDTPPNGMGPSSLAEFLSTGALQLSQHSSGSSGVSHGQSSARAMASAQASLSANALSYLLPATTHILNSVAPSATNGHPAPAAGPTTGAPGVAGTPAVFSQELHDNLNMFLKTATAYLVMLINEHGHEREL